jgi:small-conductance mechanosensitive channel
MDLFNKKKMATLKEQVAQLKSELDEAIAIAQKTLAENKQLIARIEELEAADKAKAAKLEAKQAVKNAAKNEIDYEIAVMKAQRAAHRRLMTDENFIDARNKGENGTGTNWSGFQMGND